MHYIIRKKTLIPLLALALCFIPTFAAHAQTDSGSGCVALSQDLSFGSTGSDVSELQAFLSGQTYPGSGLVVSGYFGYATRQAVINFQYSHGLPPTGVADAATRNAISDCGNASQYQAAEGTLNPYSYPYGYPPPYQGQCVPQENGSCNCYENYCATVEPATPLITNISGPNTIPVDTNETWNVTVSAPSGSDTSIVAHWSTVDDGEGVATTEQTQTAYDNQTLSFSHTYYLPGTYLIEFTATSATGQESSATETVTIEGNSNGY